MQFHPNKNFVSHDYDNGILWVTPEIDSDRRGEIHLRMCRKEVVANFKYTGSFVWIATDGYFYAQVDHLWTYPLWYNDDTKEIWASWSDIETRDFELDNVFYAMRELFQGTMTVGNLSGRQGVDRIPPDHYVKNGTIGRYTHTFDLNQKSPPISSWSEILEKSILQNCQDGDVLFLSGGRDSTTIANYAIHHGINLQYVHITSKMDKQDTRACFEFQNRTGIKVEYINPGDIEDVYTNRETHWHDGSFRFKYNAMKHVGGSRGITGEFGASERGHQTINYILQSENITTDKLVTLHLSTLESRNDFTATKIFADKSFDVHEIGRFRQQAYDYLMNYFEEHIAYHYGNASNDDERFEVLLSVMKQEHESYRLYGYSQDMDHSWRHPFACYDWSNVIFNTNPIVRRIGKHERWVYRMATKELPWFVDSAWQFGKPRGLGSL